MGRDLKGSAGSSGWSVVSWLAGQGTASKRRRSPRPPAEGLHGAVGASVQQVTVSGLLQELGNKDPAADSPADTNWPRGAACAVRGLAVGGRGAVPVTW